MSEIEIITSYNKNLRPTNNESNHINFDLDDHDNTQGYNV